MLSRMALAALGCAVCAGAAAQDPVPLLDRNSPYLLGMGLSSSSDHLSREGARVRLRPLWAFQLGRFKLASSGASSLLSVGRETVDPGLSTVLLATDGWKFSASLKLDDKRSWRGDPEFEGLPDVRRTLRGRATASGELFERSSWSLSASQDLLGRGGGLLINTGLGYRYPVTSQTYWDVSVGAGWGTDRYRNTHYGISAEGAAATGLSPYSLGAGWNSVSVGWGMTSALSRHWVAYGGVGASQLQGAVARSPLVRRTTTYGATVGLAYRSL
jgi:MipA family protein